MDSLVTCIIVFVAFVISLANLILTIIKDNRKDVDETPEVPNVSKELTESYIEILNGLISMCSTYQFQSFSGKQLSMNIGVESEIENSDVESIIIDVENKVYEILNGDIKKYLSYVLGNTWLKFHIHFQTLTLIIQSVNNYSK